MMKILLGIVLAPFWLISNAVDHFPELPKKVSSHLRSGFLGIIAGLIAFFGLLGLWTAQTIVYESTDDLKSVGYKACVQYGYDDPRFGQTCEEYEYRYKSIGSRITEHFRGALIGACVVFCGCYLLVYQSSGHHKT